MIGSGGAIADQFSRGADVTEGVGSALQQQRQNEADAAYQGTQRLFGLLGCLLYTSPSPRDRQKSRMPSSA